MGESAHLSVLAVVHVVGVCLAKLALVLFGMVKLLDPVVRFGASFSMTNALEVVGATGDLLAHLTGVAAQRSSPVLFEVVVVKTPLRVVVVEVACVTTPQDRARLSFEFG